MNNNAPMFTRLVGVFLDLMTFLGYVCGVIMLLFSKTEVGIDVSKHLITKDELIKYGLILVGVYFVLDILFTKLLATTPGKLATNCDVDFHSGNSFGYVLIRSFIKVFCLFTVIPGLISYMVGSSDLDSRCIHDKAAKSNVTNTTRMPRWVGVVIVFVGFILLAYFIYAYHDALGIHPSLNLPKYKIFDLSE